MKQILRIASVFALACAALLYTGCAKDYSEEIQAVKNDLKSLQEGTIADHTQRIANIEQSITDLEGVDAKLQAALNHVKDSLAAKTAALETSTGKNAQEIAGLKQDVAALQGAETTLTAAVRANRKSIDSLALIVKQNVDDIAAHQTAIQNLSLELGTISGQLGQVETNLNNLTTKVGQDSSVLAAAINEVKQTAEAAAQQAQTNLGEINWCKDNFANYYKKGEVDGLISELKNKIKADSTALAGELSTQVGLLEDKDQALDTRIDTLSDYVKNTLVSLAQGDSALAAKHILDIQDLQGQIDGINDEISTIKNNIASLQAQVCALGVRVASISVCPTKDYEIKCFKLGMRQGVVFRSTFEFEPVVTAKTVKKEDLIITFAQGLQRTKATAGAPSPVAYKSFPVDSVSCDENGRIVVFASHCNIPFSINDTLTFFALTYNGVDTTGSYTVTSEYAQAIENKTQVDLNSNVYFAKNGVVVKQDTIDASALMKLDYIQAKDSVVKDCFKDYSIVYDNSDSYGGFLPTGTLGIGSIIDYAFKGNKPTEGLKILPLLSTDYPVVVKDSLGFDETIKFDGNGAGLFTFVDGKQHWTGLAITLDSDIVPNRVLRQKFELTKVQHPVVKLDPLKLIWNYKQYKSADRKDTVIVSNMSQAKEIWKDATEVKGAKATKQLGFNNCAPSKFGFGIWDQAAQDYLDTLTVQGVNLPGPNDGEKVYRDTLVKDSSSDSYKFAVEVQAEAHMPNQIRVFYDTIPGSLSKSLEITVEKVLKSVLIKNGSVDSRLISGLTGEDAKYENVFAAASDCINAATLTYKVDGQVNTGLTSVYDSANDKLTVTVPAGILNYSKTSNIDVNVSTIFGFNYTLTIKTTTQAIPFKLVAKPWLSYREGEGYVGVARGDFKTDPDWYTIEKMYYNKQVRVDSLKNSNELPGTSYTVKFVPKTTYYGSIGNAAGAQGVSVSDPSGDLAADILTWGSYTGTDFGMKAILCVNGIEVDSLSYKIETQKPVKYVSHSDISAKRITPENCEIKLWEGAVVNGIDDAIWQSENLVVDTTGIINKYHDTYLTYGEPKDWTIKLNGQYVTIDNFVENVDYMWDAANSIFTVMGDNIEGKLEILVNSTLNYYLDKQDATSRKHTAAESLYFTITVENVK